MLAHQYKLQRDCTEASERVSPAGQPIMGSDHIEVGNHAAYRFGGKTIADQ